MEELKRLQTKIRENGLTHYLTKPRYIVSYGRYLLNTLKERWPEKSASIYVLEMSLEPREISSVISPKFIDCIDSMEEYARIREIEEPSWNGNYIDELKRRFEKGDLCCALLDSSRVVSHIFVTHNYCNLGEVSYQLDLPESTVGFYDVYTLSSYREKGLYKTTFNYCVDRCYRDGFKNAWMWIPPNNFNSLVVHRKLGMQKIILEVSMHQRRGFRFHSFHRLKTPIDHLPELEENIRI